MERTKTLLILALLCFITTLSAQPVTVTRSEVKVTESGQTFYLHTVGAGQTLFSIARAYGVDQAEIVKHNPGADVQLHAGQTLKIPDTSAPAEQATPPAADPPTITPTSGVHVVGSGETLFGISRRYNVSVAEIMAANPHITQFDNLRIGEEIHIPEPKKEPEVVTIQVKWVDSVVYHQVQRGESVFGISRQYNIPQDSLIKWNPKIQADGLRRGQSLRIVYRIEVEETLSPEEAADFIAADVVTKTDTILHQIQEQETLFGLARRYNTTTEKILELNPELKDGLKKGHFIYIPVTRTIETERVTRTVVPSKGCEKSRYKNRYKVALMIPLYLDEIDRIHITPGNEDQLTKPFFKSFSFIEFYQGALIALDSIKRLGFSVDLHVYDITEDTLALKRVLNQPELVHMDLVIGPFFQTTYSVAARFAIQHQIKLVSPFARNPALLTGNENLFQVNASSESKMAALARHIALSYEDPRVIFVMQDEGDRSLADAFRSSLETHTAARSRRPYYTEVMFGLRGLAGVSTQLDATKHNIVVNLITGETVVSNYVANIARLTRNFDITMFGIPEWKDYRTFDLKDLMLTDLHLFSSAFVNYECPGTIHFLREYRRRYKGEPEEDYYGFMGYDITLFFMKALHHFGLDFEYCLDDLDYRHLASGFHWQRHGKGFENIYLNIFRYQEFALEPVPQKR